MFKKARKFFENNVESIAMGFAMMNHGDIHSYFN